MMNDKRFLGGAAAVAIVAALGGFGIARWTASEPAATEAASGNTAAPKEEKKNPDTVAMTAQAVQQAGIAVETINPSGLGAEIVAQATVSASPQ
ncbi:MAG: efflux RND transporter periplasmic adaptor subunit, partial [Pseudomonadota bacterium]